MLFPLRYELPLAGVIYPHLKRGNIQQGGRKVNFTQLHDSPVQGPVLHWGLTPAAPCQAGRGEGIPLPGCGAVGPAAPASLMARPAPSLSHLVPSAAPAALRPVLTPLRSLWLLPCEPCSGSAALAGCTTWEAK